MGRWLVLIFTVLLAACASPSPSASLNTEGLWDDARFKPVSITTPEQVMAVSPAMRRFLTEQFPAYKRSHGVREGLFFALRDGAGLRLAYDDAQTRTAAEAFEARAGNCLSLVLMTSALARELGLRVQVNEVEVGQVWSLSEQFALLSGHVNVSLESAISESGRWNRLTIDFVTTDAETALRNQPLSDARVLAMFMNNRAVEAMERGQFDAAYGYLRSASQADPSHANILNTLGALYRQAGAEALAERAWSRLIDIDPRHVHALSNLERLMRTQNRTDQAQALAARLERLRDTTPFLAYVQGLQAAQRGDWVAAKRAFERELKIAPQFHALHLWLARAHLQLGNARLADAELAKARELAPTPGLRQRYQAKLDALRSL